MARQIQLPPKYQVPSNWEWIDMGKLVDIKSGYPFDSKRFSKESEGRLPLIRIRDVVKGKTETFTDEECSEEYVIRAGEILIGMDGDFNVAKWRSQNALLNQRVCKVDSNSPVLLNDYLYYYLPDPLKKINDATPSVTVKHLSTKTLNKTPLPVPPLAEQKRIVDRIESIFTKLDEAKEKAQEVVDGFEMRKSAILHKAFTGELTEKWREKHKITSEESFVSIQKELLETKRKKIKKIINNVKLPNIPKEWKYVDLDEIAKKITDGEHSTPNRVDEFCGYYLLSARNVRNDKLDLDNVDYVDRNEYEKIRGRCNPKKNDILISCSGSVGRTCVINDNNYYVMVRSAALVSVVGCNPRFIMYMIMSGTVQGEIKMLSKQTAQANFFIGAIAALKIPFPPIEEQNEIVHLLDNLMQKEKQAKETAEVVIEQIDVMKKAVLARAFRGELGTNDPEEESAMELLKSVINL